MIKFVLFPSSFEGFLLKNLRWVFHKTVNPPKIMMKACYCSLNCFPKPSLSHHSPCPLQFEDVKHVSCSPSLVSLVLEKKSSVGSVVEVEKNGLNDAKVEIFLKSSLKDPGGCAVKRVKKRRVNWMDFAGKELVEIREFDPLESREVEEGVDSHSAFMCVIQ